MTPFASLAYLQVSAKQWRDVRGRYVPKDANFPDQNAARRFTVAETEANLFIPAAGLAVGWSFFSDDMDPGQMIGVQAIFEMGRQDLEGHSVNHHYPDQTVDVEPSVGELSQRAGVEGLFLPLGGQDSKVGLGLLVGLYWHHRFNPILQKNSHGAGTNFGIAVTW
ncbi:MAG: hypothetical protein HY542_02545 [Deltaproteobacteria bacterium]|nr:hypothetical protein [Deltaproteobacteria bacterium]